MQKKKAFWQVWEALKRCQLLGKGGKLILRLLEKTLTPRGFPCLLCFLKGPETYLPDFLLFGERLYFQ